MKAIILAAGRGSRMLTETDKKPKCLTKLFNKTLLEIELDAIKKAKVEDIYVVRGYMKDKISIKGINYIDNDNWESTNMVSSLCCASKLLESDECIISYSDIIYESRAIEILLNSFNDINILYNTNWRENWELRFENPLDDLETFKIDSSNKLTEIGNKTDNIDEIEGQYMGLLKITPNGWKVIQNYINNLPETVINKLDMTKLLLKLIERKVDIYGIAYSGLWLEVDNKNDLKIYEQYYKDKTL